VTERTKAFCDGMQKRITVQKQAVKQSVMSTDVLMASICTLLRTRQINTIAKHVQKHSNATAVPMIFLGCTCFIHLLKLSDAKIVIFICLNTIQDKKNAFNLKKCVMMLVYVRFFVLLHGKLISKQNDKKI
jgi:hypothetical protein